MWEAYLRRLEHECPECAFMHMLEFSPQAGLRLSQLSRRYCNFGLF